MGQPRERADLRQAATRLRLAAGGGDDPDRDAGRDRRTRGVQHRAAGRSSAIGEMVDREAPDDQEVDRRP